MQSKTKEINSLEKDNERLSKEVESAKGKFSDLTYERAFSNVIPHSFRLVNYLSFSDKSKEKAITNGIHNGDEKEHNLK